MLGPFMRKDRQIVIRFACRNTDNVSPDRIKVCYHDEMQQKNCVNSFNRSKNKLTFPLSSKSELLHAFIIHTALTGELSFVCTGHIYY